MILTPAQKQIVIDNHRFRVVVCGRRFGKTTLAIEEMKGLILSGDKKVCYIANTFDQARDLAWAPLKKELAPAIISSNEQRLEITVRNLKGGESIISLKSWESLETLRGRKFDFIFIDEVDSVNGFSYGWLEVLRPTLTDTKGGAMFMGTPKGFKQLYDLSLKELKDSDYKTFHFTTYDNPNIPREEVDKARLEMNADKFSREYLAEFTKSEGLVYTEFKRDIHLYEEFDRNIGMNETLVGIDFGYKNPTAVLKILKDRVDRYWVDLEWYKSEQLNSQIVEIVKYFNGDKTYPDPEAPDKIQELKNAGVNCYDVVKGKDSIENGITKIKDLFKNKRLFINKRCVNLIEELESYSYDEDVEDKNKKEKPVKNNDHALDALRYVILMNDNNQREDRQFIIDVIENRLNEVSYD